LPLAALPDQSRPTALFTANDLTTMGVIDCGMHTQLALVGFDEFALADKLTPPISLVAQDPDVIGTTAATMLFARINGDVTPPAGTDPAHEVHLPRLRRDQPSLTTHRIRI
jgi:DNA-binding LacI/PurR family transcriptional regulator